MAPVTVPDASIGTIAMGAAARLPAGLATSTAGAGEGVGVPVPKSGTWEWTRTGAAIPKTNNHAVADLNALHRFFSKYRNGRKAKPTGLPIIRETTSP
jgi:hypothetical protein